MLERSEDTEFNLTSFAYKENLSLVKFIVLSWNSGRLLELQNFLSVPWTTRWKISFFLTPEKLGIHVECKRYIGCLAFISLQ